MKYSEKWFCVGIFIITFFISLIITACAAKPEIIPDPEPEPIIIPEPEPEPEPEKEPLIEMIFVQGGTFEMGSRRPRNVREYLPQPNQLPARQVTVRSFYLGTFEVTQGEYFEVMGDEPSNNLKNPEDSSPDGWKKLPVEFVPWYAALEFCNRLSIMENLEPVYRINGSVNPDDWGSFPPRRRIPAWDAAVIIPDANGYRLPTEAEWEYAARGGTHSRGYAFAGSNDLNAVGWDYNEIFISSHEVGQKEPNELGLYDMSGNVAEWCWDWLSDDYSESGTDNPTGPSYYDSNSLRVSRGGSFSYHQDYSRVTYRHGLVPQTIAVNQGFRVARNAPQEIPLDDE